MLKLYVAMMYLLLAWAGAFAALGGIPLEKLIVDADVILVGEVTAVNIVEITDDPEAMPVRGGEYMFGIQVLAEVAVELVIKGPVESRSIRIGFQGGVEDSADYKLGEEVVVFLKRAGNTDIFETLGMLSGKFTIEDGIVVRENAPTEEFLARIGSRLGEERTRIKAKIL